MIGIFDSGIGGLTVAKAIMDQLPGYDILYLGDTARYPYGSKSAGTIARYMLENINFLIEKGASVILVACHSASSSGIDYIRERCQLPVFDVVSSAADLALDQSKHKRIGVIGTRTTVNSGIYERIIMDKEPDAKVYSAPCPLLVPLIEEGWVKRTETRMIVKKYLIPLKARQIDSLILGCTHYPLLKDIIQLKIGKKISIIDSSFAVASKIKTYIEEQSAIKKGLTKNGQSRFFLSDINEYFKNIAQFMLRKRVELELASIKSCL